MLLLLEQDARLPSQFQPTFESRVGDHNCAPQGIDEVVDQMQTAIRFEHSLKPNVAAVHHNKTVMKQRENAETIVCFVSVSERLFRAFRWAL